MPSRQPAPRSSLKRASMRPQLRAEHAAETAALKKLTYTANATAAVAAGANNQIDLAIEASKNLPRSGSKMVNRFSQWLSGNLQPTDALSAFEVFVYSAARDAAKVTSGAAGAIAGVPVSAAEKGRPAASAQRKRIRRLSQRRTR